jgi:hypothetical protein
MSFSRIFAVSTIVWVFILTPYSLRAQDTVEGSLETVASLDCNFSLMTISTWTEGQPTAEVDTANLVMQFVSVNADEGTAEMTERTGGIFDIIVRYSTPYLHFVQSFRDGPLYTTTVLERESTEGKLLAMHSRHEYTDYRLTGYTSSPEQYYGECEIVN